MTCKNKVHNIYVCWVVNTWKQGLKWWRAKGGHDFPKPCSIHSKPSSIHSITPIGWPRRVYAIDKLFLIVWGQSLSDFVCLCVCIITDFEILKLHQNQLCCGLDCQSCLVLHLIHQLICFLFLLKYKCILLLVIWGASYVVLHVFLDGMSVDLPM